MHKRELVDRVKFLLAQGEINEAIQLLLQYVNRKEEINTIVNQSGRYRDLMNMVSVGIISHTDYLRDLNNLRWNILNLLDSIEETDINPSPVPSIKGMKGEYLRALARIRVLELLKDSEHGLTVTEVHSGSGIRQRKYIVSSLNELKELGIIERYRYEKQTLNKLSSIGKDFLVGLLVNAD
ncbi:MAG: hypothetical protein R2824_21770 [Saprospiraceae bacterium]|nr:hypothetical protein [Lewinella sp.]